MGNKTILVIEDDEINLKLVKALFKFSEYNIVEAGDAEAGIQLARECRPELILMDVQLPGMDGMQATRIIKEDPALKDITVVALSSHAMVGDEEKAKEAGCDGYMTKPIDTRNFITTVAQYL